METIEAKILLKNLLKRIRKLDDDTYELKGTLTDDELDALQFALLNLDGNTTSPHADQAASAEPIKIQTKEDLKPVPVFDKSTFIEKKLPNETDAGDHASSITGEQNTSPVHHLIELDTSVLDLEKAPSDIRLCLDFGTAMSKATLVRDETLERDYEDIDVLKLGIPGDQEDISETMLVSSVFIDLDGLIWFGQSAVNRSLIDMQEGSHHRLDNIKRYLSEEGMNDSVGEQFNPTDISIKYGDMVLAYLIYLTWAVNQSLEDENLPRNLNRRFAMPCFGSGKSRETAQKLHKMLGQAQILADTFYKTLHSGIPLDDFMEATSQLKSIKTDYPFIQDDITEPLGVAGSLVSWKDNANTLIMIVDVGAGTSDFSLYRMAINIETGKNAAMEVEGSATGITEAGNHLDKLLKGLIFKKIGIDHSHELWKNINGELEALLRDLKESLFRDGFMSWSSQFITKQIDIELDEFVALKQVKSFAESLKKCMTDILENIDVSFIRGAPHNALAVVLTGGGAELPMVQTLAQGDLNIKGIIIRLVRPKAFPQWLEDDYPDLEGDYPRIAVSLGGARKRIIDRKGTIKVTAGGIHGKPYLTGSYN